MELGFFTASVATEVGSSRRSILEPTARFGVLGQCWCNTGTHLEELHVALWDHNRKKRDEIVGVRIVRSPNAVVIDSCSRVPDTEIDKLLIDH